MDLRSDLAIPDVASAQLCSVDPDVDSRGLQSVGNSLSSIRILRCIAKEHSSGRCVHDGS
jgi:hypothetical protein